jgi:hypothetical protein
MACSWAYGAAATNKANTVRLSQHAATAAPTYHNKGSTMTTRLIRSVACLCVTAALILPAVSATAQSADSKEKPRLYTYVASWQIPRAKWDDMDKQMGPLQKTMDQSVASGAIVAYGSGTTVIHTVEGETHDDWWCGSSQAGVLNVLEALHKAGGAGTSVLASATKHWDNLYVSRFYGWQPGSVKGGYVHGAVYKFKPDAPVDGIDTLSRNFIVPLFEKLQADGSVQAWQVAEEAVHTQDPDFFFIFYVTARADGLDKVNSALSDTIRTNALALPAFGSMVDTKPHRDFLAREDALFK